MPSPSASPLPSLLPATLTLAAAGATAATDTVAVTALAPDPSAPAILTGARPRIDPSGSLPLDLTITAAADLPASELTLVLPAGWTVTDTSGATPDAIDPTIVRWPVDALVTGTTTTRTIALQAPDPLAVGDTPTLPGTFQAWLAAPAGTMAPVPFDVLVAPRVVIAHTAATEIDPDDFGATPLAPDAPVTGQQRFASFRIRFQLRNADVVETAIQPELQVREAGTEAWHPVRGGGSDADAPFQIDPGWVPTADGSVPGPEHEIIPVDQLHIADRDDAAQVAVAGQRIGGSTDGLVMTLPATSVTELEFVLEPGTGAAYQASYEFRLTDAGAALPDAAIAMVRMGAQPPIAVGPDQHQGVPVEAPGGGGADTASLVLADTAVAALAGGGMTGAGVQGAVVPPSSTDVTPDAIRRPEEPATSVPVADPQLGYSLRYDPQPALRYRLALAQPIDPPSTTAVGAPFTTPHTTGDCAACHREHTSRAPLLLKTTATDAALCLSCHDGITGSVLNTKAVFNDAGVPADNATTRDIYRHSSLTATTHTRSDVNEFGGVSNRHAACVDCHDSHKATDSVSTQTTTGWTVSGQLTGASGVIVTNPTNGTTPAFALTASPTLEYQLCFKCHSAFTTLPTNTGYSLKRHVFDKAVEFNADNPANLSYHPIEKAGRNTTTAMANSLSGTSSYKLWNFTTGSLVRCVNCHGDPRKYSQTTKPGAGDDLSTHTSPYRGLLMQRYDDRTLLTSGSTWSAARFALCFLCHAEAPFADRSGNTRSDTNFKLHGLHTADITTKGSTSLGTDIDTPRAGQSNALCAECHYRIHSTLSKQGGQAVYARGVNFSPNVVSLSNGALPANAFDLATKSCTLTCHGQGHDPKDYR